MKESRLSQEDQEYVRYILAGGEEIQVYLRAAVRDYGPGFSSKDLKYAEQEFYSGDKSRHDRKHSGLGLSIAKRFVQEQGGFLEYGNREDKGGAEVALWLLAEESKRPIDEIYVESTQEVDVGDLKGNES